MLRKVCLFTAHSPLLGGGGVILRSLIENLPEFSIHWKYLANNKVSGYEDGYLGKGIMGGAVIHDIYKTWKMLSGASIEAIDNIVQQLIEVDCESFWIISHNEGLRIAMELVKRGEKRPVHLTVHDDWAGALCARSTRYRFMGHMAQKLTIFALKNVPHYDVVSTNMQNYYLDISGRKGRVCHRYLPSHSLNGKSFSKDVSRAEVKIGHIGSIYDKGYFLSFLEIVQEFSHYLQKMIVMHMWGCHFTYSDVPARFQSIIEFHPELPENEVIPYLADCDFVYSMYPMNYWARTFCKTSLPTKLTSYVQAGRPILGHAPGDSTLADFIETTSTGVLWSNSSKKDGIIALKKIYALFPTSKQWSFARKKYFGEDNLETMKQILLQQ